MLFQSTPAIAGGRTHSRRACQRQYACCFNPLLDTLADLRNKVSIHARHCWRANPPTVPPPPPLLPLVSIHARHCWRANPLQHVARHTTISSFNPRPPLLAGEPATVRKLTKLEYMFQSTPAIAGGRTR